MSTPAEQIAFQALADANRAREAAWDRRMDSVMACRRVAVSVATAAVRGHAPDDWDAGRLIVARADELEATADWESAMARQREARDAVDREYQARDQGATEDPAPR